MYTSLSTIKAPISAKAIRIQISLGNECNNIMNVDLVFEVIKNDSKRIFSFYDEIMLHIQILKVVLQGRRL